MRTNTLVILIVIGTVAACGVALAQGSGRKQQDDQWSRSGERGQMVLERILNNERMIKKLGLSEEQVSTLRNGIFDPKKEKIRKRADLQIAATEQARILTESEIDERALMEAVEETGQIRTELAKLHMQGLLLMHKTLTKEQRSKIGPMLRQKHQRARDMRGKDQRRPGRDRERGPQQRDQRGSDDPQ